MDQSDGWTVYTEDRLPSAQWEYTILITESEPEILATDNNDDKERVTP